MYGNFLSFYNNFSNLKAEEQTDFTRVNNLNSYIDSPFLQAVSSVFADNVIGGGLSLQATPDYDFLGLDAADAERWTFDVEHRWRKWEEEQNWGMKQYKMYKSYKVLGGALLFFYVDENKQLRVVVKDTSIIDISKNDYLLGLYKGLQVNRFFEVEKVFLRVSQEYNINSPFFKRRYSSGKETFLFFSPPDLAGQIQTQGIFNKLNAYSKRATDFINFQVETAKIQAAITAFLTSNSHAQGNTHFGVGESKNIKHDKYEGGFDNAVEVKPGTIMKLERDEAVNLANVNRTVPNIKEFLSSIAQVIGAYVGLPSSVVLRSFDKSYSASRAEIQESWKRFNVERKHFISQVQKPVYVQWLMQEILEGRIKAPKYFDSFEAQKAWSASAWTGVNQPSIDPIKDAKAAALQYNTGIVSKQTLSQKSGFDFEDEMQKVKQEDELVNSLGIDIKPQENTNIDNDDDEDDKDE